MTLFVNLAAFILRIFRTVKASTAKSVKKHYQLPIAHGSDAVCVGLRLTLIKITANAIVHREINNSTNRIASVKVPAIRAEFHPFSSFLISAPQLGQKSGFGSPIAG